MPKQLLKIDQFHGGLSTNDDPRDIAPNELAAARDIQVDELGKIRPLGGAVVHGEVPSAGIATLVNGYGLFQFSTDHKYSKIVITASADISGQVAAGDWVSDSSPSDNIVFVTAVSTVTVTGRLIARGLQAGSIPFEDGDTIFDKGAAYGGSPSSTSKTANGTATITPEDDGEDWLAMWDGGSDVSVDLYDKTSDNWKTGAIDLGSTTGAKPVYYFADGVLRVCDGSFNNTNKWFGYIKRTHFDGLSPGGTADDYDEFFSKDQEIAKPTRGLFGQYLEGTCSDDISSSTTNLRADTSGSTAFSGMDTEIDTGVYVAVNTADNQASIISARADDDDLTCIVLASSATWRDDTYMINPPAGTGFNVNVAPNTGVSGTWTADDYEIATTFIYDNNQESLIFENIGNGDLLAIAANNGIDVKIICTAPFNPRITGGRVYIRKYDTGDQWSLLAEISLKEGVRATIGDDYSDWNLETAVGNGDAITTVYLRSDSVTVLDKSPLTYEILNGWSQEEDSLHAFYKTAVVANRTAYIGNVQVTDEDGETKVMGDALIKSPVNKFDTFPISRRIEASIRDGDEIVKLESYADRILQFKRHKLHIINISQELEFLEDTFEFKGVSHPAATCKTDYGIAWVNEYGVYLYDGKEVHNLLERQGRRLLKDSDWYNFLTAAKDGAGAILTPMIAYYSKKRQLLIFDDVGDGSGGTNPVMHMYDMVTQSWVQASSQSIGTINKNKTNFVTDWNGDLIYGYGTGSATAINKWDGLADASSAASIKTKDFDFGNPAQKKNVYNARISYKGDADTLTTKFSVDGDTDTLYQFNSDNTPLADQTDLTKWHHIELIPSTPSQAKNIYSFQLHMDGTIDTDFELNDISLVYRLKGIR